MRISRTFTGSVYASQSQGSVGNLGKDELVKAGIIRSDGSNNINVKVVSIGFSNKNNVGNTISFSGDEIAIWGQEENSNLITIAYSGAEYTFRSRTAREFFLMHFHEENKVSDVLINLVTEIPREIK